MLKLEVILRLFSKFIQSSEEEEEDFSTFSNKKEKDAATTLLQKASLLQKVDDLMGEKKFQFFSLTL